VTTKAGADGRPIALQTAGAGRRYALLNSACVVCGAENPSGLRLSFRCSPEEVTAEWTPTGAWESFQGVIHGGIIATVLDEAMSKAIVARQFEALTAELRVRFRRQVSPGDALRVRAWVVEKRKRRILAEAVLTAVTGGECARAWAAFLILRAVPAR
jgi:acyl-coenzyme A thioesterase PaaI-like protein